MTGNIESNGRGDLKRRLLLGSSLCLSVTIAAAATRPATPVTSAQRAAAASAVAHAHRSCLSARPFYWEIGDRDAIKVSGTEGGSLPLSSTSLPISTSSEWIFAAWLVQSRAGALTPADIRALTMRSGYTHLQISRCVQGFPGSPHPQTVTRCFHAAHLVGGNNSDFQASQVDRFFFNGGHVQQLAASDPRLSGLDAAGLTAAIGSQLGTANTFTYESPLLDAGIRTTPAAYAGFLRKTLAGQLLIGQQLGADPVCTNPSRCSQALNTPLPLTENSHFSLGHWVEDDPRTGDGAFSDPGLLGFYPWIDASRTWYGVLARSSSAPGSYVVSMQCGRQIRKAWLTGRAP
jgi:hypothetical protein